MNRTGGRINRLIRPLSFGLGRHHMRYLVVLICFGVWDVSGLPKLKDIRNNRKAARWTPSWQCC